MPVRPKLNDHTTIGTVYVLCKKNQPVTAHKQAA